MSKSKAKKRYDVEYQINKSVDSQNSPPGLNGKKLNIDHNIKKQALGPNTDR